MWVAYIGTIYGSFEQFVVNRDQLGTPVNQFPDLLSFMKIIVNAQEIICLLLKSMAICWLVQFRFENFFLTPTYLYVISHSSTFLSWQEKVQHYSHTQLCGILRTTLLIIWGGEVITDKQIGGKWCDLTQSVESSIAVLWTSECYFPPIPNIVKC